MKYCLSDCAKRKLSAGKKALVEFITVVCFTWLVLAAGFLIFILVGLITQGIFVYFKGNLIGLPHDVFLTGLLALLFFTIIAAVFVVGYTFVEALYTGVRAVVTNRLVSEDYYTENCKIIVECTEVDDE